MQAPNDAMINVEDESHISDDLDNGPDISGVEQSTPDTSADRAFDAKSSLKLLRLRNIGRVIVGYLNINSVRNKLDALREIVSQNLDILMIAETKIDASFPTGQFTIEGFATPFRLDRNANGGGLLVYVRSDIPAHRLNSFNFSEGIECISFEINLRKKKWVLFSVYRPPNQSQDYLLENLGRALDHYSENYENFMFIGDFNMTETEEQLKDFLDLYSLKNLVHEPTCYKSQTAKCIDLVLTNRNRSVQQTTTVETGLSDFYKMVVSIHFISNFKSIFKVGIYSSIKLTLIQTNYLQSIVYTG